ncbi:hypothetical protein WMY93_030089 [Mugilogobius chulae]|uniref:LINE-1 type transposase domain-containing 1 n=1 Tax=Mugilogobius chulae TaxID=88201 RepID=A0AAW0MNM6_9GOBI
MSKIKKNPGKKVTTNEENQDAQPEANSDATANAAASADLEPSIVQALDKVTHNLTKVFEAQIATVLGAIREQTSDIQAISTRIDVAEERIAGVETLANSSEAKLASMEKQIKSMQEHIEDLENRNRRSNVRILGVPEGREGSDPVKFFETWIPRHLQLDAEAGRMKLDWARRAPPSGPYTKQRPRPLMVRFHHLTDKCRVMDAARRLGPRQREDDTQENISFFNDYSADVIRRRKAFDNVKAQLRKFNVSYALLYPATLRVSVDGQQKRFGSPGEAAVFVSTLAQRSDIE